MVSFENDYATGAHPKILERLEETNLEPLPGYGTDYYCEKAKEKIKSVCGRDDLQVEFLTGGTQTNTIVISTVLNDWEGVVAADTGHINVHEAGAIEYSSHKVLSLPGEKGKLMPKTLNEWIENFYNDENHEHMVFPGMVYISHPTEYGTLYSKEELKELHDLCRKYDMPLYLDGARLGYALMSSKTDVSINDIASLTDIFYIGGTKVGLLCGEAVVFTHQNRPEHFMNSVKKRGALLAKGRLLGVQFDALFTDDLYFKISAHAINMSEKLKNIFHKKGIPFFLESPTNQQFVILEDSVISKLRKEIAFSFWEKYDNTHTVVRFATSWSTTEDDLNKLEDAL